MQGNKLRKKERKRERKKERKFKKLNKFKEAK
jgi:hypothetical protein